MQIESIPTYEQFITEYVEDQTVTESYKAENEAWDLEKSYGCGNSSSKRLTKGAIGGVGGVALLATSVVCPPAGIIALGTAAALGGIDKVASELVDKDGVLHDVLEATSGCCETATAIGSAGSSANWGGICRGHSHG